MGCSSDDDSSSSQHETSATPSTTTAPVITADPAATEQLLGLVPSADNCTESADPLRTGMAARVSCKPEIPGITVLGYNLFIDADSMTADFPQPSTNPTSCPGSTDLMRDWQSPTDPQQFGKVRCYVDPGDANIGFV